MKKLLFFFFLIQLNSICGQNYWVKTSFPTTGIGLDCVLCMTEIDKNLFVGSTSGLFVSKDDGETWENLNPKIKSVNKIEKHENSFYIMTADGYIYKTIDFEIFYDMILPKVRTSFDFLIKNDEIIVGTSNGIYSLNFMKNKWNFEAIEGGNEKFTNVLSFTIVKDIIYATSCGNIIKRINNKWLKLPNLMQNCGFQLKESQNKLVVNTSGQGIMIANPEDSSDITFLLVDPNEPFCNNLSSVYFTGTDLFALSESFLYDVNLKTQEFVCNSRLTGMLLKNNKIFIGTAENGVWTREISNTSNRSIEKPMLNVFPNPILDEEVTLEITGNDFPNDIFVFDLNGRKVFSSLNNELNKLTFRLENNGFYIVVYKQGTYTLYKNIIKNK